MHLSAMLAHLSAWKMRLWAKKMHLRAALVESHADEPHLTAVRGREGDRVLAGEARVAMAVASAQRRKHAVEREVAQRIGGDVARDLVDRMAGRDELAPRGRV